MNNIKTFLLLIFFFVLALQMSFSQKQTEKSIAEFNLGNKYFNEFSYRIAIKHYLKAYKIDTVSDNIKYKLAKCYYKMRDFEDAEYWANKLANYDMTENDMYHYIEILASNKHYHEAEYWFQEYQKFDSLSEERITRIKSFLLKTNYSNIGVNFWINPISVNSEQSDFAPTYFKDGIVFLSGRKSDIDIKGLFKNDGINFLNLYYTEDLGDGKYSEPVIFNKKVKSKYHEGPIAFYDDNKKIIFTQSNIVKRKLFGKRTGRNSEGSVVLNLYIGDYNNDTIENIKPFKYNSYDFSSAHPTVSEDGKKLIFSSNRQGTKGGTDLYICNRINGSWSEPVNLGDKINTEGKELFSYLNGNILYFTSDGHTGLGGLDIYFTTLVDNKPTKIINPGYQINSTKDDFSLISKDGRSGYFASNRGNSLNDEIYFAEYHAPPPPLSIELLAIDSITKEVLHDPDVQIIDTLTNEDLIAYNIIGDSIFQYMPDTGIYYRILINHIGYFTTDTFLFSGNSNTGVLKWIIPMFELKPNEPFALNNIYYDFDKATLRDSSKIELNRVIKWLEENEDISIEIHSHTDSWGNDNYNLDLSKRRAKSVVDYLIASGIDKNRLVPIGYGETQPLVDCPIPKNCSKEDHQKNRRTELMIIDNTEIEKSE